MFRLVKILLIILITLFIIFTAGWFYVTLKVASRINNFADQPVKFTDFYYQTHFFSFKKARPTGFPYQIAWKLEDFSDETRKATIKTKSPIYFGYNLLSQKLFVSYNGETNFIPRLNIRAINSVADQHSFTIDLPIKDILTKGKLRQPFKLINHVNEIVMKVENMVFTDAATGNILTKVHYDQINFRFTPAKYYQTIQDFLKNIPEHSVIDYQSDIESVAKSEATEFLFVQLPIPYRYLITNMNRTSNIHIDLKYKPSTQASSAKIFALQLEGDLDSSYINFSKLKANISSSRAIDNYNHVLKTNAKLRLKKDIFEYLFNQYNQLLGPTLSNSIFAVLDQEIKFLIQNKDQFDFKKLEESDYEYNLSMALSKDKDRNYLKIEDFQIDSESSGVKLKGQTARDLLRKDWQLNGILLLRNYPAIVDFSSNYIYRFGKFKALNEEARDLYTEVNKIFLKQISDYPRSNSNDLSMTYEINSEGLFKGKIGNLKAHHLLKLYNLQLYYKLFDKVGSEGDTLKKMQAIIPTIDPEESLLKNLLARRAKQQQSSKPLSNEINH